MAASLFHHADQDKLLLNFVEVCFVHFLACAMKAPLSLRDAEFLNAGLRRLHKSSPYTAWFIHCRFLISGVTLKVIKVALYMELICIVFLISSCEIFISWGIFALCHVWFAW